MWTRLTVWATRTLLRSVRLSVQDRVILTGVLLDRLKAIPLNDIITQDVDGRLLIRGKQLDLEQAQMLRESARRLVREPIYKLVREQVQFKAITIGVYQGDTPEKLFFSKSALWQIEEGDKLYKLLAQNADDPD